MRTRNLTGRQIGQICAAALTAALVLLSLFSWFRYDRSRTLHYALEKAEPLPGYRLTGWEVLPGGSGKGDASGRQGSAARSAVGTDPVPDLFSVSDALTEEESGEAAGAVPSVTIRAATEKIQD